MSTIVTHAPHPEAAIRGRCGVEQPAWIAIAFNATVTCPECRRLAGLPTFGPKEKAGCGPSASPDKRIVRKRATAANCAFWDTAERTAAEVESWPVWKRAGINVGIRRGS